MGELFKHFEGWDVQALRREAKEAKEEAKEEGICKLLKGIKKYHASREEAVNEIMEAYELTRESAEEKMRLYW